MIPEFWSADELLEHLRFQQPRLCACFLEHYAMVGELCVKCESTRDCFEALITWR